MTLSKTARRLLRVALWLVAAAALLAGDLWAQEQGARRTMGFFDVLTLPRVWVGALFCLAGVLLLVRARYRRKARLMALPVVFFAFAVVAALPLGWFARGMGLHPSPICSVTKPFLFLDAGRSIPPAFAAIFVSIAVLSVAGNKLFCGWACPVGALQELVHDIPGTRRVKVKLPFKVTNWVRVALFIVFVPTVFLVGKSIYDYFNPFETLHWGVELYGIVVLSIVLVASVFVFRPFCYVACPVGLITWLLERVSVARIEVDQDRCTECFVCVDEAPCPSMDAILDRRKTRPDCHACGRCLDACSENALKFTV